MDSLTSFIDKVKEPVLVLSKGKAEVLQVNSYGEDIFASIVGKSFFSQVQNVDSLLSGTLCRYKDVNYTLKIVELDKHDLYFLTEFVPRSDLDRIAKELAALMVHVFRSPLSGVMGFTELLLSVGNEAQKKYARTIEAGLQKLVKILDEVESLAKEPEAQFLDFNVNALMVDVMLSFSKEEQEVIDLIIEERNAIINNDYVIIRSILIELLNNALQFSNPRENHVQLTYKKNGSFQVRSYSEPISERNVKRLYLPFYSTRASNTGLGLTRVALLAHAIQSDIILLENSKKKGITFELKV
jgi:signal transduction histidine kinase